MITHHLLISVADLECPLTICADHCVINRANEIEFYDANDRCIAIVPDNIIIEHTES